VNTYLEDCEKAALPFRKKATRRHAADVALVKLDALDARRSSPFSPLPLKSENPTATR
jgi:hypothetical protein